LLPKIKILTNIIYKQLKLSNFSKDAPLLKGFLKKLISHLLMKRIITKMNNLSIKNQKHFVKLMKFKKEDFIKKYRIIAKSLGRL